MENTEGDVTNEKALLSSPKGAEGGEAKESGKKVIKSVQARVYYR